MKILKEEIMCSNGSVLLLVSSSKYSSLIHSGRCGRRPLLQLENKELAQGLLTGCLSPWTKLVTRAKGCFLSLAGKLERGGTEPQIARYFYFCGLSEC